MSRYTCRSVSPNNRIVVIVDFEIVFKRLRLLNDLLTENVVIGSVHWTFNKAVMCSSLSTHRGDVYIITLIAFAAIWRSFVFVLLRESETLIVWLVLGNHLVELSAGAVETLSSSQTVAGQGEECLLYGSSTCHATDCPPNSTPSGPCTAATHGPPGHLSCRKLSPTAITGPPTKSMFYSNIYTNKSA